MEEDKIKPSSSLTVSLPLVAQKLVLLQKHAVECSVCFSSSDSDSDGNDFDDKDEDEAESSGIAVSGQQKDRSHNGQT